MENNKTALNSLHKRYGAKFVSFAGYEMPIQYSDGIIEEHKYTRENAGIFDVSHMSIFDLSGSEQEEFLKYLLPNDVDKIKRSGRALYSPLLNNDGGVLDDLIVYNLGTHYRIISNCATRSQNHDWFVKQSESYDVKIKLMNDLSIIAIQGPNSINLLDKIGIHDLDRMSDFDVKIYNSSMIAKTGYTGEEGFEVVIENSDVESFWLSLLEAGASAIGLGARDTLRLEKGYLLSGVDFASPSLDDNSLLHRDSWETNVPFGLDTEHDFIGKSRVISHDANDSRWWGVIQQEKGPLPRGGKLVEDLSGNVIGTLTSGAPSPSLNRTGIGMGYLSGVSSGDEVMIVASERKKIRAIVKNPPFV